MAGTHARWLPSHTALPLPQDTLGVEEARVANATAVATVESDNTSKHWKRE